MDLLALCCVIAYCIKKLDEKGKADYRSDDNNYREMIGPKAPKRTEKPGRYTAGYGLYQLRWGWPSLRRDMKEGWNEGKRAHDEWRQKPDVKRTPWEAWREGWRRATPPPQPAPEPKPAEPPADPPAPPNGGDGTKPSDATAPEPGTDKTEPTPPPATPTLNGVILTTPTSPGSAPGGLNGEAGGGITPYRDHNKRVIERATQKIEGAQLRINAAQQDLAAHENVNAQLAANGVGAQTAGGMAQLVDAANQEIAAASALSAAAEAERAAAQQNLDKLASEGHNTAEEALKPMNEAATTSWYRT